VWGRTHCQRGEERSAGLCSREMQRPSMVLRHRRAALRRLMTSRKGVEAENPESKPCVAGRWGDPRVGVMYLSAENSYLSWTRNGVITTVASVAVFNLSPRDWRSDLAGLSLLFLGGHFILVGTVRHVWC